MTETTKLLSDLVALPSVNPAFVASGNPNAGEWRVAEFLAHVATRAGLDVELQHVQPGRTNVITRLNPRNRVHRRVLLVPHLDTVDADASGFQPRMSRGRLFGRGACDTKGSVAAMIGAMIAMAGSRSRPLETEVIFAGVVDEENAQAGSRALVASKLNADLAIVGEPTKLQVVTAHKGNLWLRLTTRGRSAHGSRPELGRNAIHLMARVVDALETGYAAGLRRREHPLLGCATVNVGTIQGGLQPNIVPASCSISVDRRTLPGETDAAVCRELRTFLSRRRFKADLTSDKTAPCSPMETRSDLPLVRQLMRAAGRRSPAGVHFFCDAAVLAEGGIPSVVFGPGDIAQAHTANEWVALDSVERARVILVHYLKSLP